MDQRTEEYILVLNAEIDRLWRYLGHTDNAQEARREASEWQRRTDDLRKETEAFLTKTFQQSSQYLSVVTVIGYAGYFTTWNFSRELLHRDESALVALTGLISLGLYCAWEIFSIQYRMKSLAVMGSLLRDMMSPDHFEEMRRSIVANEAKWVRIITPVWRIILTICIGTTAAGAIVMGRRLFLSL